MDVTDHLTYYFLKNLIWARRHQGMSDDIVNNLKKSVWPIYSQYNNPEEEVHFKYQQ